MLLCGKTECYDMKRAFNNETLLLKKKKEGNFRLRIVSRSLDIEGKKTDGQIETFVDIKG